MLQIKEGKNQLRVLSTIASLQLEGKSPRQKDITERTSLTKGAVSNNCKKLEEKELVSKEDNKYQVDESELFKLYREHLENYLPREKPGKRFKDKINRINEVRTTTKSKIEDITNSQTGKLIKEVIMNALAYSNKDGNLNNLRDVFHKVDFSITKLGEVSLDSDNLPEETREHLMLLAVSIDKNYKLFSSIPDLQEISKTETATDRMIEKINEVK